MDYFTKWPEAYSFFYQETTIVAEILVQQWVSRFGIPLEIHSDQGTNFTSAVFKGLCQNLGINKTQTTHLHNWFNGVVERFKSIILNNLSLLVFQNQQDCDLKLPLSLLAYRGAANETTGYTPSQMQFGRELRIPCDIFFSRPPVTSSLSEK